MTTPVKTGQKLTTAMNQKLLEQFGFKGKAGPEYGLQGEKFLDTLSLAEQNKYVRQRNTFEGQETYQRKNTTGFDFSALGDLFKSLMPSLINPPVSERVPTIGDANIQTEVDKTLREKSRGRAATILSDFTKLDAPTGVRKTLLGA